MSEAIGRRNVGAWLPDEICRQADMYRFNQGRLEGGLMGFIEDCVVEFLRKVDWEGIPERLRIGQATSAEERNRTLETAMKLNQVCDENVSGSDMKQKVPRLDDDVWMRAKYVSLVMRVNGISPVARISVIWYLYENDYRNLPEYFQIREDAVVVPPHVEQELRAVCVRLPKPIISQIRNYRPDEGGRSTRNLLSFITGSVVEFLQRTAWQSVPRRYRAEFPRPSDKQQEDNAEEALKLLMICSERYTAAMTQKTPKLEQDVWDACMQEAISNGFEGVSPVVRMAVIWALYRKDYDNLPECFQIRRKDAEDE